MPVLYNYHGAASPGPLLPGSFYILSTSISTWSYGTALLFLALLGFGIRRARSRVAKAMPSSPPPPDAKTQSNSPLLAQVQQSHDPRPSYAEKERLSSLATLTSSPVAAPEYQFWTAELPAPTLSPVDVGPYEDPDPQLPQWGISREPRDVSRTTSLPLPAPRRRSYNKSFSLDSSMGIEVSEEIIIAAEGWRRHTRVYGGGVCQACLESEQKQGEMLGQAVKT